MAPGASMCVLDEGLCNLAQTVCPGAEQGEADVVRVRGMAVIRRQVRPSFTIPCHPWTQPYSKPGITTFLTSRFTPEEELLHQTREAIGKSWQNQSPSASPAAHSPPPLLPSKCLAGCFANVCFLKMT